MLACLLRDVMVSVKDSMLLFGNLEASLKPAKLI